MQHNIIQRDNLVKLECYKKPTGCGLIKNVFNLNKCRVIAPSVAQSLLILHKSLVV